MGSSSRPRLEIQFDESTPAYRSGRKLKGAVVVDWHNGPALHVARLSVECIGYSEVQEPGQSSQKRLRREHLRIPQNLLQQPALLESRRFEFEFLLPPGQPHSIECDDVGFVRYCCRAVACLDSGATTDTVEAVAYFSLIEEVDLNSPAAQLAFRPSEQASASTVERVGGRSSKDVVKASLVLAKGGYVPGENVECTLSVHCGATCGVPVDQANIRLVQLVSAGVAVGDNGGRSSESTIVEEQVHADEQYSEHYWSARCQLHIPGTVASSQPPTGGQQQQQHRPPLVVRYAIEVRVSLAYGGGASTAAAKLLSVSCPVVIGTVPLRDSASSGTSSRPSFVEVCRCVISEAEPISRETRHAARSNSLLNQLIQIGSSSSSGRRKSSYRMSPPIQYTLYCIYYPTISIARRQKGLIKSILKRHSAGDGLDSAGGPPPKDNDDEPPAATRTASTSWYETPC